MRIVGIILLTALYMYIHIYIYIRVPNLWKLPDLSSRLTGLGFRIKISMVMICWGLCWGSFS